MIESLRADLHNELLIVRRVERFIQEETFAKVYSAAPADQQEVVTCFVRSHDLKNLVKWTKATLRESRLLDEFTVTELRTLCGELSVSGYRHMTKNQMLTAVRSRS